MKRSWVPRADAEGKLSYKGAGALVPSQRTPSLSQAVLVSPLLQPMSWPLLRQLFPPAGAARELPPPPAEAQGAKQTLSAEEQGQELVAAAALSACQCLSPDETPSSEGSEGWIRGFWFLHQFLMKKSVSPRGAHSPGRAQPGPPVWVAFLAWGGRC